MKSDQNEQKERRLRIELKSSDPEELVGTGVKAGFQMMRELAVQIIIDHHADHHDRWWYRLFQCNCERLSLIISQSSLELDS